MGKRLTEKEREEKQVNRVLKRIIGFEKSYPIRIIERACFRYKDANLKRRTALKEKQELEEKLSEANRILNK